MPIPGDTVSTEPVCPGVTERTEATKPASPAAPASAPAGVSASGRRASNRIASSRDSSGRRCLSSTNRWCSGSATSVPDAGAAGFAAAPRPGAPGRIRQKAASLKLPAASPRPSVASAAAPAAAKRRRSGHSSVKIERHPPAPLASTSPCAWPVGKRKRVSLQRLSQIQCQNSLCGSCTKSRAPRETRAIPLRRWYHGKKP
mmetsp:Transcript_86210/g.266952  ORF Transcript_86210/g.266952 Transcript_86210/m.266952 type:complete len:201 (-) Transcript_86210:455-1057(-)